MSVLCVEYRLYLILELKVTVVANAVVNLIGVRLMRPIDADLLMENLGFDDTEEEREENVGEIITWEDVDSLPTAFDVEQVVRELKELKMRYYMTIANTGDADKDCAYLNTANAIDKAIEIVKRGGREC